jgi:hypothetical protein
MKRWKFGVLIWCVAAVWSLYVATFFMIWRPLSAATSRNVEFLTGGRRPVVGPEPRGWVTHISPPQGSGFCSRRDYTGNEWIFQVYKP